MARIIETHLNPLVDFVVNTKYVDGDIISNVFRVGDVIENLRYASNGDIVTITGKLTKITQSKKSAKRDYSKIDTAKSYFAEDITATSIDVDCSEQYNSNIVTVPTREILEFMPNENEVERMIINLSYGVHLDVELSDETMNSFDIHEGNVYKEFTYLDLEAGLDKTVTAKVVAITYDNALNPVNVVFTEAGSIKNIDIKLLKNAEGEVPVVEMDVTTVTAAIESSETGIVNLAAGEINEPLTISKNVVLMGVKPDAPVNSSSYKGKDTGTIISGGITVENGCSVELRGITLTKDSYLKLTNSAKEVTLVNCVIKDINPYQAKSYLVLTSGTEAIKLVVKNCFFGSNTVTEDFKYYNAFELTQMLADGSEISNNYFEEGISSNNTICIYNVENGANIYICNNIFEYSGNAIRVGTKDDTECNIFIENNTYFKTDTSNSEWAGLLLIQPYGKATTSMKNVTIILGGNKHNDKLQLYYFYSGDGEMEFNDETSPVIIEK